MALCFGKMRHITSNLDPTQTGLYSHRKGLETGNFGFKYEEEELYYLRSENKVVDQLYSYSSSLMMRLIFKALRCFHDHSL